MSIGGGSLCSGAECIMSRSLAGLTGVMELLLLEVLLSTPLKLGLATLLLACVHLLIPIAALEVFLEVNHVGELPCLFKLQHLILQAC